MRNCKCARVCVCVRNNMWRLNAYVPVRNRICVCVFKCVSAWVRSEIDCMTAFVYVKGNDGVINRRQYVFKKWDRETHREKDYSVISLLQGK